VAEASSAIPVRSTSPARQAFLAIATGGFVVGALDLMYAMAVYQPHHPIVVLHTIASGLLGPASYQGGVATAILGLVLQFLIASIIAAIYYAASRKVPYLLKHPITSGIVYGACVYSVMHGLVLPLSNTYHDAIPKIYVATEFIEHWFFVGLPIALSVRYFR
jgi:hypothetical protein